ncbi:unnamed protein product [Alopecurus aequalis]
MAKSNPGYLGVSEPISLSGPTEKDVIQTAEVEKFLAEAGLYESQQGAVSREEVLGKLDQTVKAWIKKATRVSGYGEQFVQEANAKIFTFGSYRLGVHGPGADIDTLCVGPRHATRNEYFFGCLHDMLAEMPEVSELHPVPDAHVPVLGFKLCGVSIDLLYANLAHVVIPEDLDLSQDSILHNVDEQAVRSLNGCRVTDQILRLVPNIPSFRTTLRFMRYWGKRRGVYSNAIDENRATWDDLLEPYPFFELYRNYLEVGITARNEDDLRNWKGWVESRLRQLVLKFERYTHEMLLAHPHPRDFSDGSRPLHRFYFMGLWRKQTAQPQEAEQFDIRGIVNEFKISVLAYLQRREGMDIEVSHVKRKDIPLFVFPGGVRPPRSSRTAGKNTRPVSRNDVTANGQVGNPLGTESWSDSQSAQDRSGGYQSTSLLAPSLSSGETQNILNGHLNLHTEAVDHEHPGRILGSASAPGDNVVLDVVTQPNTMPSTSSNGGPTNGLDICLNSSHKDSEGIRGNNLVSSSPAVIDELVSYQAKPDNKHAPVHGSSLEGCSEKILGQTCNGNNHLKRKAEEELEPLELAGPSFRATPASTSTVQRKPLRLRLSTLPQPKQAE